MHAYKKKRVHALCANWNHSCMCVCYIPKRIMIVLLSKLFFLFLNYRQLFHTQLDFYFYLLVGYTHSIRYLDVYIINTSQKNCGWSDEGLVLMLFLFFWVRQPYLCIYWYVLFVLYIYMHYFGYMMIEWYRRHISKWFKNV